MPPERRRQILQRLNNLELLSDQERRTLRGRFDAFSGLPMGTGVALTRQAATDALNKICAAVAMRLNTPADNLEALLRARRTP